MFLALNQKLGVYRFSRIFVLECYRLTKVFAQDEKIGMVSPIRRAALPVHLNIGEVASRRSEIERKRYYEISRGSIIEIDAVVVIANDLKYLQAYNTTKLAEAMIKTFKTLTGLIVSKVSN